MHYRFTLFYILCSEQLHFYWSHSTRYIYLATSNTRVSSSLLPVDNALLVHITGVWIKSSQTHLILSTFCNNATQSFVQQIEKTEKQCAPGHHMVIKE